MTRVQLERLTIRGLNLDAGGNSFAQDVAEGLTSTPKTLPPKYFYDGLGSRLFEAICRLPEYYLTRSEAEILTTNSDEIAASVEGPVRLIEFGSGNSEKTRCLIEAFLRRQKQLHYVPVDISWSSLERSSRELLRDYPGLTVTAYAMEYYAALARLSEGEARPSARNVALFLGSNIGNFDEEESRAFLRGVRTMLDDGGALLLGADLKKSTGVLLPAYDDALGVTAAFNLNILGRINRELGGEFNLKTFEHKAAYNDRLSRIEMRLMSRIRQVVPIRALSVDIAFEEGETIHTENSYKFDLDQLAGIAKNSGFSLTRSWFDESNWFSFNFLAARRLD